MLITLQNYTVNYIAVVNEWLENLPQSVPRFCSCMDRCINYNQLQGWLWQSESGQAINRQWFKWWLSKVWHTKAVSALWIHFLLLLCFSTQETNVTTGSFAWLCCIKWSLHHVWNQLKLGWKEQSTTDLLPTGTMEWKRCRIQCFCWTCLCKTLHFWSCDKNYHFLICII